ncbi:hypothetical protein DM01DRAFT_1404678 [Hesseltinella vesiculosa]|uniref:Uncharacterized protein n=1 Tax=Hesseltinella vesiculosa TaxID=101127 RepID=A0A1X2GSH4_9FUNG|nr:hypothetical protein DM01DRAFT_1404678 [Hesseltinella vesiculosa]
MADDKWMAWKKRQQQERYDVVLSQVRHLQLDNVQWPPLTFDNQHAAFIDTATEQQASSFVTAQQAYVDPSRHPPSDSQEPPKSKSSPVHKKSIVFKFNVDATEFVPRTVVGKLSLYHVIQSPLAKAPKPNTVGPRWPFGRGSYKKLYSVTKNRYRHSTSHESHDNYFPYIDQQVGQYVLLHPFYGPVQFSNPPSSSPSTSAPPFAPRTSHSQKSRYGSSFRWNQNTKK